MAEVLNLMFASSLTDLCEVNSSFDSGILRIAYTGANQNKTFISKQAFEKAMKTMYNCPIVANYDRENDEIGSHDMSVVKDNDGKYRLINLTQPLGVVPESAQTFWQVVEEDDGTEHEYLCTEVLLWKRQEVYKKIKDDGVTAQSMEINVKSGKREEDGLYHVYDFEFTAFALLGTARPCFESASLTFALGEFKEQLSEMMLELKESFNVANPSIEGSDIHPQKYSMEGGQEALDKNELIEKYGIDVDALDFSIDDFSVEELEEKFKAMTEDNTPDDNQGGQNFALTGGMLEELQNSLRAEKVQREWGECSRYSYVDCDFEAGEVYAYDTNDWMLYGFKYQMNGDNVVIDFESKSRKKFAIVDFDEGEQVSPFGEMYAQMGQTIAKGAEKYSELEEKFNALNESYSTLEAEAKELREFKADTEVAAIEAERTEAINEVFAEFEDLSGIEAFEVLKGECEEDCMKYEIEALKKECFAIRGMNIDTLKFSAKPNKSVKIKVEKDDKEKLPYGGIFEKYGFSVNE